MAEAFLSIREKAQSHQDAAKARRLRDRGGLWQPLSPSKNRLMTLFNSGNLFGEEPSTLTPQRLSEKTPKRRSSNKKSTVKHVVPTAEDKVSIKSKACAKTETNGAQMLGLVDEGEDSYGPSTVEAKKRKAIKSEQLVDGNTVNKFRKKRSNKVEDFTSLSVLSDITDTMNAKRTQARPSRAKGKKRPITEVSDNEGEGDPRPSPKKRPKKKLTRSTETANNTLRPSKAARDKNSKEKSLIFVGDHISNDPKYNAREEERYNKEKIRQPKAGRKVPNNEQPEEEKVTGYKVPSQKKRKRIEHVRQPESARSDCNNATGSDDNMKPLRKKSRLVTTKSGQNTTKRQDCSTPENQMPFDKRMEFSTIIELEEHGEENVLSHCASKLEPTMLPRKPQLPTVIANLGATKRRRKKVANHDVELHEEYIVQATLKQQKYSTSLLAGSKTTQNRQRRPPESDSRETVEDKPRKSTRRKDIFDGCLVNNDSGNIRTDIRCAEERAGKDAESCKIGECSTATKKRGKVPESKTVSQKSKVKDLSAEPTRSRLTDSRYLSRKTQELGDSDDEIDFLS